MNQESEDRCDLVQFDFVDHYNNNTLKAIATIGFLQKHLRADSDVQHVLMVDDDTFLNLPKLYEDIYLKVSK